MVADFPELHENIHDAEEVTVVESLLCLITVDVLVVEKSLPARKVALDDVLNLVGQLLFNLSLHSAQQEWPENRLELLNHGL